MPTYVYECSSCHHRMEVLQKMSDERLQECPECKGKLCRQIGSGSGLIFKGTGFYITDYKKKNVSTSTKETRPTSPSTNTKETKSQDSSTSTKETKSESSSAKDKK